MKILIFFIFFLCIGAFFIISNENLRINNGDNLGTFSKLYSEWISNIVDNGGNAFGYVFEMKWLPES